MGRWSIAVRVLGLFAAVAAASLARAQSSPDLFPKPAGLAPAVAFWTRVYTEIDTDEGFIHDSLHLDIVYGTVEAPSRVSSRERRSRVEKRVADYRAILSKLGRGARDDLSAEEARVLALFPQGTSNAELAAASERLRFQLGQSDRFLAGLVRSGRWKPYIYEVLEQAGLPRELAALPHVESSFDPTAYSKVGAAGIWQFTRSTGVRYMQVNQIVDERRDPFFATRAAAQLLADNHDRLRSWPLALTAYNHGVSGMRRASQQHGNDIGTIVARYKSRSFGFASRNFYAAFLAALQIDSDPEKYFGKVTLDPPSPTAVVRLPSYFEARTLAKALDMRESALRELNPALTETVWAGDKYVPKGFELRLPKATAATAGRLLDRIDASERYAAQRRDVQHRVRRGDTLSGIAAQYGVSLAALMRINDLSGRAMIRVGQMISLPAGTPRPAAALAAADVAPPAAAGQRATYVVKNGDSIARIAARLGVGVDALLAANTLGNRNVIHPGQTLQLPRAGGAPAARTAAPVAAVVARPEPALVAAVATPPGPGENLGTALAAAGPAEPVPAAAEQPAAEADAEETVAAAETDQVEAVGELDAAADVNALASTQAELAADPSDYSVASDQTIQVQALETLGHYADWLGVPTQRLRDLNRIPFRQGVVIGQRLKVDLSRADAATFERRRVAYQQAQQGAFFARYQIADTEDHVIKSGESLWLLAARTYKVPVWLLRQYNPDLDPDRVRPGTVVKFPRLRALEGEEAPEATVADSDV